MKALLKMISPLNLAVLMLVALVAVSLPHAANADDARNPVYSKTYDPGSLVDAAGATTTVTVPPAVLGDACVASFSLDLQGITVTCYVSAAGTASVRFQNESGGTLDLASGTLRVFLLPHGTR